MVTGLVVGGALVVVGGGALLLVLCPVRVLTLVLVCSHTLALILSLVAGLVGSGAGLLVGGAALRFVRGLVGGLVFSLINRPAFWCVSMLWGCQGVSGTLSRQIDRHHKLRDTRVRTDRYLKRINCVLKG